METWDSYRETVGQEIVVWFDCFNITGMNTANRHLGSEGTDVDMVSIACDDAVKPGAHFNETYVNEVPRAGSAQAFVKSAFLPDGAVPPKTAWNNVVKQCRRK